MVESLIIFAILLIVIMAFLMYYSKAHYAVKAAVFPALIAAIIFGAVIFQDRLGAPINSAPKGDFQYVYHQAGSEGSVIYIWVWTADRGQRLHILPYERELMEQLEEAKGRAEGGQEYGQFNATEQGFEYEQGDEPHMNSERDMK